MRLDRNVNNNGRGKYALLKLRGLSDFVETNDPFQEIAKPIADAIDTLEKAGILDWGAEGTESEFFVIRLKDRYAKRALTAYAQAAQPHDMEYSREVFEMALRSGPASPFCKAPD